MINDFIVIHPTGSETVVALRSSAVRGIEPVFKEDKTIKEYDLDIPTLDTYITILPEEYDALVVSGVFPKLI